MKSIVNRMLAASSAAFFAVSAWPAAGLADEPSPECEPPPPPAPPPHASGSMTPRVILATPPRDVTTYEERTPNSNLIGSGTLMFGLSYGGSVIVGAASDRSADQSLFIPVAGPWMNIAGRSCPEGAACPNETANKVLLAADGLFQAAGVMQIIAGFVFPEKVTTTRTGIRVTPNVGARSVGITASGSF